MALQAGDEQTLAIWCSLIEVSKLEFQPCVRPAGGAADRLLPGCTVMILLRVSPPTSRPPASRLVDDGALVVFAPGDEAPLIVRKTDGGYGTP